MQKEQLLPRLLTNHYEQEETAIDGESGRVKQERGGEMMHVLLYNNFPSKYLLLQNPFNI